MKREIESIFPPGTKLTISPNYRFEIHSDWENEVTSATDLMKGWVAVSDDERGGIIAYFGEENEAWVFVEAMRAKHKVDGLAALFARAHSQYDV